jgi:spectinomycin phosphotransferase/16S rRNA (guanine(1405)-N(7))-methyltransferase
LPDLAVVEAIRAGWALEPVRAEYSAVGFGSHHWEVADAAGRRWFVSVDDLATRRRAADDSPSDAYERLRAALLTASALRDSGAQFVVAPSRATDGDVVHRIGDQYAVALYPFVDARFRDFDDALTEAERDQVLRLIAELHTSSAAISGTALVEDFVLAQRDEIARALEGLGTPWGTGPYGERARSWFTAHATRIEEMLGEHDRRAHQARQRPDRMVLSHGEPHPGNLIETSNGWLLVDWDTALVAPPERDLWHLQGAESNTFEAYLSVAGHDVVPPVLDLYRLTWELDDIASLAARFHRAHEDTEDARHEWADMARRSL